VGVLDVRGRRVAVVDEFVCLGALERSSVLSGCDVRRRGGLARGAVRKSDNCIWKSRLSLGARLGLYGVLRFANNAVRIRMLGSIKSRRQKD